MTKVLLSATDVLLRSHPQRQPTEAEAAALTPSTRPDDPIRADDEPPPRQDDNRPGPVSVAGAGGRTGRLAAGSARARIPVPVAGCLAWDPAAVAALQVAELARARRRGLIARRER
jgi:hypothetical protein